MTREEAKQWILEHMPPDDDTKHSQVMAIAIQALSQEPKILNAIDFAIDASNGDTNYFVGFRNGLRYAKSLIDGEEPQFESCAEQEPCDDAISRKTLLTNLYQYKISCAGRIQAAILEIEELVEKMPSVTQKSGKWIWSDEIDRYVCDKCGQSDGKDKEMVESGEYPLSNYCHNCGAKMESEDKE